MKKRLLMPSRGKPRGGRCAVLCVLCSRVARIGGSGHVVGQSMPARLHPTPPVHLSFGKEPSTAHGPPTPPGAVSYPGGQRPSGHSSFLARRLASGLSSPMWPWCPLCPPVLSAIAL